MNAMILAAGRGERLRPITDHTPKPLISINGKSPIRKHLENLDKADFSNVVINVSHLSSKICKTFGTKFGKNISISYSFEPKGALETAGGIAYAEPWNKANDPFLVLNGDIWSDWNVNEAYDLEREIRRNSLWGYLIMVDTFNKYKGDFFLDSSSRLYAEDDFSTHTEKLYKKLTFSGFGIYTSKMFNSVTKGEKKALKPIFNYGIKHNLLMGREHEGDWFDIGTHQNLEKIRTQLEKTKLV